MYITWCLHRKHIYLQLLESVKCLVVYIIVKFVNVSVSFFQLMSRHLRLDWLQLCLRNATKSKGVYPSFWLHFVDRWSVKLWGILCSMHFWQREVKPTINTKDEYWRRALTIRLWLNCGSVILDLIHSGSSRPYVE